MAERPTLRQLEYFLALSEKLNFRAAAEACHVTQPALSAQIQQLERRLGVRLFERDARGVRPTAAGEALVGRAREILTRVDGLLDSAQARREPLTGELRLGVIPTIAPYLLPRVHAGLRRRHPGLRLYLREAQTAELVARLEEGDLDVLLLALEADLGGADTEAIASDPFLVGLPAEHPLAARDVLSLSDLEGEPILLLEEGHCLRDQALPACERAGTWEVEAYRASSLGTLVQMVASGLGVTLVPEVAVPALSRVEGLAIRPLEPDGPSRTLGLAWRPASARAAEFRALAASIASAYAEA
jgi:LysR family transcriptional regulator, hydrogen peroxide-inducible genes activator